MLRIGLGLAAVVVAAIAANVALLSLATASHEPVGRLSPVVATPMSPAAATPTHPAPPQTVPASDEGADD